MWRFLFEIPSFYPISSGTLLGCHPLGTSTPSRSPSSFCCLCCVTLILFSSSCLLLLFTFPSPLFLIFCPFLNVFFLGHNKLVWWTLFCPVVGLLELPMYNVGHPLVSFHKATLQALLYQNLNSGPRTQATRHLLDTQIAVEAFKVFHVEVWKEYSDREGFSHSMRNVHWFKTFKHRCGKGSSIFSILCLSAQPGHQPVLWKWRQFCCFPLHPHEGIVPSDVLETSMVWFAGLKVSHGMYLLIFTEEKDTQVCVKYRYMHIFI